MLGERTHRFRAPSDVLEVVGFTGGYRDVRIMLTTVDENFVFALPARKPDHAASDLLVGDFVLGVAAIALESHRSHRL